jgi:hypothetical protein
MTRDRWAIRVTYRSGDDAWLRHGPVIGEGRIATFTTREHAEREARVLRNGLDADDIVMVVKCPTVHS